ncbi:hypothetical protein TWF696_008755 [Orbilia brochopaga]|uniref:BZIP domain-containing protein n=1 Tax=Orbilia brochopaga TaxID=3140254 RepID=A0AAV9UHW5_9PEZI
MDFDNLDMFLQPPSAAFTFGQPANSLDSADAATKAALELELQNMRVPTASVPPPPQQQLQPQQQPQQQRQHQHVHQHHHHHPHQHHQHHQHAHAPMMPVHNVRLYYGQHGNPSQALSQQQPMPHLLCNASLTSAIGTALGQQQQHASTTTSNANNNTSSPQTPDSTGTTTFDILHIKSEPNENTTLPPDSPPKKRRQPWGRQLTPPTTNLPPRKRAKTEAEKQQRAYERVIRNRKAAETSRQRKQAQQDQLLRDLQAAQRENQELKEILGKLQKGSTTFDSTTTTSIASGQLQQKLGAVPPVTTGPFPVDEQASSSISSLKLNADDNFVAPAALSANSESPVDGFDTSSAASTAATVSPTSSSSLVESPDTSSEEETPETPTELRAGNAYSHLFGSQYASFPPDPLMLSTAAEPRKPNLVDLGTGFADNSHFNDVFDVMNYDKNSDTDALGGFTF